jgi:uncharacterized protein YndB with AHSA1/START domain
MTTITVQTIVAKPIQVVWDSFIQPEHITKWAFASSEWECPYAENDVRAGGRFLTRMAAKDGSASFDFTGTYTDVIALEKIAYKIDDERRVTVTFTEQEGGVLVEESFETEPTHTEEQQRVGWQAILDSFKAYTESLSA